MAKRRAILERAAKRRERVGALAELKLNDKQIGKRLGLSPKYVRELRLKEGVVRQKHKPLTQGWSKFGLRITNMSEGQIAELYDGRRYDARN